MSRSSSMKYKRYRQAHPKEPKEAKPEQNNRSARQRYFGEMLPCREDGVIDLTPYAAAIGQELISTVQFDSGRSIVKRMGRPMKQRALI